MSPQALQSQTPPAEPSKSPLAVWNAIRKAWYVVVPVAVIVTVAVTISTLSETRIFESTATLVFDPQPPRPLGSDVQSAVDLGASSYLNNREYYKTQQEILTSHRVALATVRRLRLHHDHAFVNWNPGSDVRKEPAASEDTAANMLRNRLNVQPVKDSRIISVSIQDADPARAQRVLSTILDVYINQNLDAALQASESSAAWLDDQLAKLKQELREGELSLHDYKIKNNILSVSLDDQSNMLREEMSRLNSLLTDARARREEVHARRKELSQIDLSDPLNLPAAELLENVVLSQLRQQYVNARSERDGLVGLGRGANHPDVKAAGARVNTTKEALLAELRNVRQSVDHEYNAINSQVEGLSKLAENAKKRAFDLNLLQIEYNRLDRTKRNTEKLYSLVLERTKELDLTRMMRFNNIQLLDTANLPGSPIKPRVPLNIALGVFAGLGLGVAAAIAREMLDRTIKTPEDAEQTLGLVSLGLLPAIEDRKTGSGNKSKAPRRRRRHRQLDETSGPELYVHDHPSSGLAEAARSIRTNIMFVSPDQPFQVLLITSAGPVEGKTTTACFIATTMAQAGQRVLLLDCDMRRPRLHRVFGADNSLGATIALLDGGRLDECLRSTKVENLDVLSCGPLPPNPAELLSSAAFDRLLSALRKRYDRIIVDSPPVAPVTDAAVLSTRVDAVVFVVRAFRTSRDLAQRALRSLRGGGGNLIGVVLNDVDLNRHEYGYQQYYYYRKEGYSQQPKVGESPRANVA